MRILSLLFALTLVSFSLSASAEKGVLWDTQFCSTATIHCGVTSIFVHDQLGRCGCLKQGEYLDPNTCRRIYVQCDELAGQTFATLTSNDEFVGCGCYKTN